MANKLASSDRERPQLSASAHRFKSRNLPPPKERAAARTTPVRAFARRPIHPTVSPPQRAKGPAISQPKATPWVFPKGPKARPYPSPGQRPGFSPEGQRPGRIPAQGNALGFPQRAKGPATSQPRATPWVFPRGPKARPHPSPGQRPGFSCQAQHKPQRGAPTTPHRRAKHAQPQFLAPNPTRLES